MQECKLLSWDEMNKACRVHGEVRNAYTIIFGMRAGKRLIRQPWHKWGDSINIYGKETGCDDVEWIHLALNEWLCAVMKDRSLRSLLESVSALRGFSSPILDWLTWAECDGLFVFSLWLRSSHSCFSTSALLKSTIFCDVVHVVWYKFTDISEECIAAIIRFRG